MDYFLNMIGLLIVTNNNPIHSHYYRLWLVTIHNYYGLLWITMDSFSLPWIDYIGLLWITMDFYGLFPPLGSTSASWFPATPGFDHRAGRDRWDHHDDVRADRVLTKKRPGLAQHVPVWYLVWYAIYIYMIYVCICIYIYISVYVYICRYVYM